MAAAVLVSGCTTPSSTDDPTTPPTTPVTPSTAPQVFATFGPINTVAGEPVSFDASGSKAGAKSITLVEWQFGDAKTGQGLTTTHAYDAPGDYVALAKVTNDAGLTATNARNLLYLRVAAAAITKDSTVENTSPVSAIGADAQVVKKDAAVTFTSGASFAWVPNARYNPDLTVAGTNTPIVANATDAVGRGIVEYTWDFGDGSAPVMTNATVKTVTHAFAAPGLYTVSLTVKDAAGRTGVSRHSVFVEEDVPALSSAPNKDVFVTATITGPKSLDPGYAYDDASGALAQNVLETLLFYDRDNVNKVIPLLAAEVPSPENGGISADQLRYTFKLRQGVMFHDNTELTADAVKFSWDRLILMKDPNSCAVTVMQDLIKGAKEYIGSEGTAADRAAYLAQGGVKVVDKYTVELNLPSPNAATFARLAYWCTAIVSPTAYKAAHEERVALWGVASTPDGLPPAPAAEGGRLVTRDPWADLNAVGTGPFTIRKWLPNDRVIFDRNDKYWDTASAPKLKTVIVQYVDDLNTRVLMLKSGAADEIYVNIRDIDNVRPQLASVANFVPSQTLIVRQLAFMFDMDGTGPVECPKGKDGTADCKFFNDVHMRMAFSHAFDYDGFMTNVLKGAGFRSTGAIPRGMPGYDPDFKGITFDLAEAKKHLAMSNHPDGFTVSCFWNSGNTARKAMCETVEQQMEKLLPGDIQVNVEQRTFDELTDLEQKHQVPLATIGWAPDYIATDDYTVPYYQSNGYFPASFQYKNPEVDAAIEAAKAETDPAKQAKMWDDINKKVVTEDAPYIFISQDGQVHVERNWVRGYFYNPIISGSPNSGMYKNIWKV